VQPEMPSIVTRLVIVNRARMTLLKKPVSLASELSIISVRVLAHGIGVGT
jgi:hypothetical protein